MPGADTDSEEESPRPHSSGYIRGCDLDDLHPQLIYGALLIFLRAVGRSLLVVAPVALSWRVLAPAAAALAVLYLFLPLGVLGVAWLLLEIAFNARLRLVRRRLQREIPAAERLAAPRGARDVFLRTLQLVEECESWSAQGGFGRTSRQWLEGWFLGVPLTEIRRGNILDFAAWAFWTKHAEELDEAERRVALEMVEECERRFGWGLQDGHNSAIVPIRINFDPMSVWCHPLVYYATLYALTACTRQTMRLFGFTHHVGCRGGLSFFHKPLRRPPGLLVVGGEAAAWRPGPPVVFFHGVGIGLPPYLLFLRRLAAVRECFVVELPEVSQQCVEGMLPPEAMAAAMAEVLRVHGHSRACFIAHSYGTFVLSWVVRYRPDIVEKAVLIDPVSLLLSQPDVAYNFLYRRPTKPFTLVVANFVRWELYSANVLRRQFYWYHNVLWADELPAESVVVLAGDDDIVNAQAVRLHLEECQRREAAAGRGTGRRLLYLPGFFHGEVLVSRQAQMQIIQLI
mmetsp:Transcript_23482/g.73211  ORF Transcript_23482/g.73211 Transcript_23482/m.73211 type:complete len:512 (+) Transcript_23482:15-1550(+)